MKYMLADMATVGEQLKMAREAQRLTVTQVAEMTKIRSDHIRAIDQSNYDVFSAPVYIRGFVRTYASAVKLDRKVAGWSPIESRSTRYSSGDVTPMRLANE